jgi:molybdopterin-guanine dinucleotide biosynthesis protein A
MPDKFLTVHSKDPIMFKQAALAVVALTLATGAAMAQSTERNVFDTETNLRTPAAASASGLTRAQVRAEFLAARAAGDVNLFDTETVAYVAPKARDARATPVHTAQAIK